MKRAMIAAAALSLLAAPAMADNKVENCSAMASMARVAMELRQTGADLPAIIAEMAEGLDGSELDVAIKVLQFAYREPLYSGERAKQEAANEFSSTVFLACMEVEA